MSRTPKHVLVGLVEGESVGCELVGVSVGEALVGDTVGESVGSDDVGDNDGPEVVGLVLGDDDGPVEAGEAVGAEVGEMVSGHASHLTGQRAAVPVAAQSARTQNRGSGAPLHCPVGALDGADEGAGEVGEPVVAQLSHSARHWFWMTLHWALVNLAQNPGSPVPWQPCVGLVVGDTVGGGIVGDTVGFEVVGAAVGDNVGFEVVGTVVGEVVGSEVVGEVVGAEVVGEMVGEMVGEVVFGHVLHSTKHTCSSSRLGVHPPKKPQTSGSKLP